MELGVKESIFERFSLMIRLCIYTLFFVIFWTSPLIHKYVYLEDFLPNLDVLNFFQIKNHVHIIFLIFY